MSKKDSESKTNYFQYNQTIGTFSKNCCFFSNDWKNIFLYFYLNKDIENGTKRTTMVGDEMNVTLVDTVNHLEDDEKRLGFFRRVCIILCVELVFL